jgi:FMN phosphatase YigB (HAD superfamily)
MPVPSVVVFDLGKVLVDFDYGIAAKKIGEGCGMDPVAVKKHIDQSPLLYRFETGLLTNEQFHKEICAYTSSKECFDNFCGHFADIFWEIEPMVTWNATLRAKGIPTYIFSNTNGIAVEHIRRRFPFFANFNGHILSYEHGCMKPDAPIYEVVDTLAGKKGAEIFYLDDRVENIEAGRKRGWQAHVHSVPKKTFEIAKAAGLPVN